MLLGLLAAQAAAAVAPAPTPYDTAVAHRRGGRHDEAVRGFRTVLDAEPDHVDALVGMGLSLAALGRTAEAEAALHRAVELAPDYWDAHLGLARIAEVRGDRVAARARLAPVLAAEPRNVDAWALDRRLTSADAGAPAGRRLDVWVGRSRLSDDLPAWSEAGAVLSLPAGGWTVTAGLEASRRFERDDVYVEGGIGRTHAGGASWRLALGGTPDADFRPEIAVRGGGSVALRPGSSVQALLDGGWARYPVVEVTSFSPGLRWAVSERLSLQGRWVAAAPSDGGLLSGYALRADVLAQPRTRLSLAYADAPESSEGLPVTVETVSLGASRDLNDQLSLNLSASHETRNSFTRDEIVLGSALRF